MDIWIVSSFKYFVKFKRKSFNFDYSDFSKFFWIQNNGELYSWKKKTFQIKQTSFLLYYLF